MVQHRATQDLRGDRGPTQVTGHQGETGGKASSCARTRDHDAIGIDAEIVGVLGNPVQPSVAVLNGGEASVLGPLPIYCWMSAPAIYPACTTR